MRKEDVVIGKVYYYNNRRVVPIALEYGEIFRCGILLNMNNEVTGSQWCSPCNIGGRETHTCELADEVIESVLENLSEEDITFIPSVYMKEQPMEFLPYVKVAAEIKKMQGDLGVAQMELISTKRQATDIATASAKVQAETIAAQRKYDEMVESLEEKQAVLAKKIEEIDNVIVSLPSNKSLTVKEFNEIYRNHLRMSDLDSKGVDNWVWYEESVRDGEDYDLEIAEFWI